MTSFFSFLGSCYTLGNLDTRFVSSTSTPYKPLDSRSPSAKPDVKAPVRGQRAPQPSRWKTPEFKFYYFVFLTIVPYMFWIPYEVSRPSDPRYHKYEHLLSEGWVPGRKIDLSDHQYRTFRENLPYVVLLLFSHPLLRRLYNFLRPISVPSDKPDIPSANGGPKPYISAAKGHARQEQRSSFDFWFALFLISALHGFSAIKIVTILYINFCLATRLPRSWIPVATWSFNIGILFANELCEGYSFERIADGILPPIMAADGSKQGYFLSSWGAWLDSYSGIMSRWEILFNITVLRLISFNLDYYWSLGRDASSPVEKQLDLSNLSVSNRVAISAGPKEYTFRNYLAFVLYSPLYLVGPILTFNDYMAQSKYEITAISWGRTIRYGCRFLLALLATELVLHFDYCIAISHGSPVWSEYTPLQLAMLSYFNLHILWLKLLLPFRLFRLWSLIDGIDPPENMLRCVSDQFSVVAFWRGWHRSYNRFLIRYIYVPLGGSRATSWTGYARVVMNYVIIFTFVALWHDIKLNLLVWGWLVVFFMLPEIVMKRVLRVSGVSKWPSYRVISALGCAVNLMFMMIANLVGFAVGVEGLTAIVEGIFRDYYSGALLVMSVWAVLFVGIQVMFELREHELRHGIDLGC